MPPPPASRKLREALMALAVEITDLGEVHDVRVRETADGEIVNFHCRVDPTLSVSAVHDLVDTARAATATAISGHRAGHRSRRTGAIARGSTWVRRRALTSP